MECYIRGVTTLHHYKRISSRDLGLHRRKAEEKRQNKVLLDKRVKPKNLERLNERKEKNTREMNQVENNPLEKRNKEHYGNLVG